jgi:hypothetical protein
MTTPTYGTATFVGNSTRKTYSVDFYLSDAAGFATWDSGSGASSTSNNYWIAPEQVTLTDISLATGPTVITRLQPFSDFNPIGGQFFRIAQFLNSLNSRPALSLTFAQGRRISLNQS